MWEKPNERIVFGTAQAGTEQMALPTDFNCAAVINPIIDIIKKLPKNCVLKQ